MSCVLFMTTLKDFYNIYKITQDKVIFEAIALVLHPNIKLSTIRRRFRDCRYLKNRFKDQLDKDESLIHRKYCKHETIKKQALNTIDNYIIKYSSNEKEEPDQNKLIEFNDMVKFKKDITRQFMYKHGWNRLTINWLEDKYKIKIK